jgi:hypothetical protein
MIPWLTRSIHRLTTELHERVVGTDAEEPVRGPAVT